MKKTTLILFCAIMSVLFLKEIFFTDLFGSDPNNEWGKIKSLDDYIVHFDDGTEEKRKNASVLKLENGTLRIDDVFLSNFKDKHKDTIVFETTVNNKNVRGNVTPNSSWFSNYSVYQLIDGEKEFLTNEASPMQGVYSTCTKESFDKIRKGNSGCGIMVYELKNESPVYLQTINRSDNKIDESKLKFNLDELTKDTYSDFETVSE